MKKWLWTLTLAMAVLASGFILLAETPAKADSCYGGCTIKVPSTCNEYGLICSITGQECYYIGTQRVCHDKTACYWGCKSPGYQYVSSNCQVFGAPNTGAPCACIYERSGAQIFSNNCPDPKP